MLHRNVMISKIVYLSLVISSIAATAETHITTASVSTWSDIAQYIKPEIKTYIFTDLDDTVMCPIGHTGSTKWFYELFDAYKNNGCADCQTALEQAVADLTTVYETADFQLTEPSIAELFNQSRANNISVHGLTARSFHLADITHKHCNQVGVCFDDVNNHAELIGHCPVGHKHGIIFCGHTPKGVIARQIVTQWENPQEIHVIFIDDSKKHVESVVAELNDIVGNVTGLHYCPGTQNIN